MLPLAGAALVGRNAIGTSKINFSRVVATIMPIGEEEAAAAAVIAFIVVIGRDELSLLSY